MRNRTKDYLDLRCGLVVRISASQLSRDVVADGRGSIPRIGNILR